MKKKKQSHKIIPPLGFVKMTKDGFFMVVEPLPDMQQDLEYTIMKKFVGVLKEKYDRVLELEDEEIRIKRMEHDQWPDCYAIEDDNIWNIEMTELVHESHAQKYTIQRLYAFAVLKGISDIINYVNGIEIYIDDNDQNPLFPKIHTPEGKIIINEIVTELRENLQEIKNLKQNYFLTINLSAKFTNLKRFRIFCKRVSTSENPGIIRFSGSYPTELVEQNHLLRKAVENKVRKRYPELRDQKTMLLLYAIRIPVLIRDLPGNEPPLGCGFYDIINLAKDVLDNRKHGFDEVWYFFPFPKEQVGDVVKIWPEIIV